MNGRMCYEAIVPYHHECCFERQVSASEVKRGKPTCPNWRTHGRFCSVALITLLAMLVSVCAHSQDSSEGTQNARDKTLALTPPMGWNSWNHFGRNVTDADVRAAADALVSSGMRDAGYVYVNIDDGWEGARDARGIIHSNERFPDMKLLAAYVHSKGLKLGIYSSPGKQTCAHFEGSLGHELQDAETFAAWGIDYLKYDLCSLRDTLGTWDTEHSAMTYDQTVQAMRMAYEKMHDALRSSGRPIVFSICQYGFGEVWKWGPDVGGNVWRTTMDLHDDYTSMASIGFSQDGLESFAGPGHWNDPDMLEIGNGHMSKAEYITQMSLWALLAAPLLSGNDLSKMDQSTRDILTNREIIAVDQDKAGIQGHRLSAQGPLEIWEKNLSDGSKAVGLFNRSLWYARIPLNLRSISGPSGGYIRDLWQHKNIGRMKSYRPVVPAHGVIMLRIFDKANTP